MAETQRLTQVPTRRPEIEPEWIDGEVLLYNQRQTEAIYLNPLAAAIWSLCDGETALGDILDIVQDAYPDDAVVDDVIVTIQNLEASGVVAVR
jgi:Coenzyme PQQ synthesis protein D (PqqD)